MRILCVIDSLGSGGAQRQMVNLAVGFKSKGHQVVVWFDFDVFDDGYVFLKHGNAP